MLTLITGGEVYAPAPRGAASILLAGPLIETMDNIDSGKLAASGLELQVVDASGCLVLPGLVDPHEHLIGAGGEEGFGTRSPAVTTDEVLRAGITTVAGLLGTDCVTRDLVSLLARARHMSADGISAYIYTGGFPVPPPTFTGSVTRDLVIIDLAVAVGEVAISDERSSEPTSNELARLVSDGIVGGKLGGKAGVTAFHVGPGRRRLEMLRTLLEEHEIPPKYIYPTHVNRSPELLAEAAALSRRGCFVDMDSTDGEIPAQVRQFLTVNGEISQLTVSSDAHTANAYATQFFEAFVSCIKEKVLPQEQLLGLFAGNACSVLQFSGKGKLAPGADADILVLDRKELVVRHLFCRGRQLVKDREPVGPRS